jgi:hypothetical protein
MSNSNNNRSKEDYKTTSKERQTIKTFASKLRSVKRQMLLKEAGVTSNSPLDDFRKLVFKITATDNFHDSQDDTWASSSFSSSNNNGLHEESPGCGSWTSSSSSLEKDYVGHFE